MSMFELPYCLLSHITAQFHSCFLNCKCKGAEGMKENKLFSVVKLVSKTPFSEITFRFWSAPLLLRFTCCRISSHIWIDCVDMFVLLHVILLWLWLCMYVWYVQILAFREDAYHFCILYCCSLTWCFSLCFFPGLSSDIYLVREGVVNEYALKYVVNVPSQIETLYFSWQSLIKKPVSMHFTQISYIRRLSKQFGVNVVILYTIS